VATPLIEKQTKGAWVVHHGRKIAADVRGAAEFSAIDLAAKSASLLARLAEAKQSVLTKDQVIAAAKVGGLNFRTELPACLAQLQERRLVDSGPDGSLSVLGVTGRTALMHAAEMFDESEPTVQERAAIGLAEVASSAPIASKSAIEFIGDEYKLKNADAVDFVQQAAEIGFVDAEGAADDRLLFNGNLFRRDTAEKTKKVLDSLSSAEATKLTEFDQLLRSKGSILASAAEKILGGPLFSKLKAAALYDMNIVSNEAGDHVFITAPGSFHKFTNPMIDDAFDHAKALVAALSYGMSLSPTERGKLWGVGLLLKKLIAGYEVGPAPAIGYDYRALEFERVVQIRNVGGGYFKMKLLKPEVGQIALNVLENRDPAAQALESLPSATMRAYTPPEVARTRFRKNQTAPSRAQTHTLLDAVRSGTSL
jgi:hypothetical protein